MVHVECAKRSASDAERWRAQVQFAPCPRQQVLNQTDMIPYIMALRPGLSRNVAVIIIAIGLAVVGLAFLQALIESYRFYLGGVVGGPHWGLPPTVIRSVDWDENTGQIRVRVEYTGNETVTLNDVYVNETLDSEAVIVPQVLSTDETAEITLSKTYSPEPTQIIIRVTISDGRDAIRQETFFAVRLDSVDWNANTGKLRVTVKNIGDEQVTLSEVYVNATLDEAAIPNPKVLAADQTIELALSGMYWDTHTIIPIKVSTLEGVTDEKSSPIFGIWIQSINWRRGTGEIGAYVYSNGYEKATAITSVYVNGTLDATATIRDPDMDPYMVTLSKTYAENPTQLTLRVATADGALAELTLHPNEY